MVFRKSLKIPSRHGSCDYRPDSLPGKTRAWSWISTGTDGRGLTASQGNCLHPPQGIRTFAPCLLNLRPQAPFKPCRPGVKAVDPSGCQPSQFRKLMLFEQYPVTLPAYHKLFTNRTEYAQYIALHPAPPVLIPEYVFCEADARLDRSKKLLLPHKQLPVCLLKPVLPVL